MRLRLLRDTFLPDATLGTLDDGNGPPWQTLEDLDRRLEADPAAKVKGMTAIPRGTYRLVLAWSTRFQLVTPRLPDVPGFEGILIHPGNTAADTAGCVLVGEARDGNRILRSREAFARLMAILAPAFERGEPMEVEVS